MSKRSTFFNYPFSHLKKGCFTILFFLCVIPLFGQELRTAQYEGKTDTIESGEIRILSWNIKMLPRFLFKHAFGNNRRARAIPQEIIEDQIDIVIFQELFDRRNYRIIKRRLRKHYPFRAGPANRKFFHIKSSSGVVMFSKLPLENLGEVDYDECTGSDCMARKGALLVEADYQGQKFQVLGTHLQAGGPESIKLIEFGQMRELIHAHQKEGIPQLLTGDFNVAKKGAMYQVLVDTLGVADGPLVSEHKYTCNSLLDWNEGGAEDLEGDIIDFIFVKGNGIQPEMADRYVRLYKHPWHKKKGYQVLSDHHPVMMKLKF